MNLCPRQLPKPAASGEFVGNQPYGGTPNGEEAARGSP